MENWKLVATDNINRMLKVRDDIDTIKKDEYPSLITIKHKYMTSDDILFPMPETLGFFLTFEEVCLKKLESSVYVAQDIDTGFLKLYIYSKDFETTIYDCINYFTKKPELHIEFDVKDDRSWRFISEVMLEKVNV